MAGSPDRLVRRIQRRLQSAEDGGRLRAVNLRELEELTERVKRLHDISDRLDHVRLSRFVAQGGATRVLDRVGG